MKVQTGYLYHIKDEFFDQINKKGLMINHENGHSRPSYLAIKDKEILWFIPLSTKVDKYRTIIAKKEKKYGSCKTILIKRIAGREQAILIQNAFPTLEKYIKEKYIKDKKDVFVPKKKQNEIIFNAINIISMAFQQNVDITFTNIVEFYNEIYKELNLWKLKTGLI